MANDQSTSDGDDSHEMGIDFGELDDELANIDYPITREARRPPVDLQHGRL